MALENPLGFIFGGTAEAPSYQELQRRRDVAKALASRQRGFPKTTGEGIAYLGEAIGDVLSDRRLTADERAFGARQDAMIKGSGPAPASYSNPAQQQRTEAPPVAAPTAAAPSENTFAGNPLATANVTPAATPPAGVEAFFGAEPMAPQRTSALAPAGGPTRTATASPDDAEDDPVWQRRKASIAKIESNVKGDPYAAVGTDVTRKDGSVDRAYGKYQVMGANIPEWTQAAPGVGRAMSPQEFLLDKKAQEAVFKHRFGQYVDKYGEEGAARAWYGGEKGMNNLNARDPNPNSPTVGQYGERYRNGIASALIGQQAPQGGGAQAGPTVGAQEGPGISPPAGGEVRVASLGPGAGGTMTDATEQVTPTTIQPAPGSVPPGAGGARIAPAPPAGVLAQAPGGLASDENALPVPGAAAAPRAAPARAPMGPGSMPSNEPIMPAFEQRMDAPGAPPKPPNLLPYSPAQERWLAIMNSRNVDEYGKAYAKSQFDREEGFRTKLNERREADYVNEREKHEVKVREFDKFVRERQDRQLKQHIDRVGLENARADLEEKYFKQGIPRTQAIEKADLEIRQARRTLEAPDHFESQGARFERLPGQQAYQLAPGSPKPKADSFESQGARYEKGDDGVYRLAQGSPSPTLNEGAQKAVEFVRRVTPDMQLLEGKLNNGRALANRAQASLDMLPGGNMLVSEEYRSSRDALMNWSAAFLTRVSGAAVSPSEAARNLPAFVPQPGDTERDIQVKAQRRREFTNAAAETSGDAGMAIIRKMINTDPVTAAFLFGKEAEKAPVSVSTPADVERLGLHPGRRITLPDGTSGQVPRITVTPRRD